MSRILETGQISTPILLNIFNKGFINRPLSAFSKASFIEPRRKTLRFSDRDIRRVPCLGLGRSGLLDLK